MVVTGGASGMGLATAKLLASRGALISLGDINEAAVKAACESLPDSDKHMYRVIDVRNSQSVDEWIAATLERFGKLDGAVNMAGIITPAKPVAEETDETWDLNFAVNARGVFSCMRAEIKAMKNGGSIVSWSTPLSVLHTFANPAMYRSPQPVLLARWDPQEYHPIAQVKQLSLGCQEQQRRRTHTYASTVSLQASLQSSSMCAGA